jgi:hypothetical protein
MTQHHQPFGIPGRGIKARPIKLIRRRRSFASAQ